MPKHAPKGTDIVALLLSCAPTKILEELHLSKSNAIEFTRQIDSLHPAKLIDVSAMALYYASKSVTNLRKSRHIMASLDITPELLYSLTRFATSTEFEVTLKLTSDIEEQRKSNKGRKAVLTRHNKPDSRHQLVNNAKEEIRLIWASGKFLTRGECAEQECNELGIPISTAIKALRNTPDPLIWHAKMFKNLT